MLDTQQITYTMDMFQDTLHLPVETPENPFVAPTNIYTIEAFMNRVGYQGVVDKVRAFYTKNLAQPWQTMFKDYHSIKDDVQLVSVYTTGNVSVRGMLILDAFLTAKIRETDDFKEYETEFIKRKQITGESSSPRKSLKITITQKQLVEKDNDDSEDMIEPRIHKDNLEVVDDDDDDEDKEREKQDDEMGSLEELKDIVSNPTISTSKHLTVKKRISSKYSHLPEALRKMCKRQAYMIQDMKIKCVTTAKF
nr:hypothetical protein [Tanacetum cinerariifolium]